MRHRLVPPLAALWLGLAACSSNGGAATLRANPEGAAQAVVPNAYAARRGEAALRTLVTDTRNPRTYVLGIAAAQLTGVPVGSTINGLSVRASAVRQNAETFPTSSQTFAACMIQVGKAKPLGTWKRTLRDNFDGTPTTVRQGPLSIPPDAYPNDLDLVPPRPNAWGDFFWDFKTPFTYEGGDLAVLVTHLGSSGSEPIFFDAVASDPAQGYLAYTASSYNADRGEPTSFLVVRLHHGLGTGCAGSNGATPILVATAARRAADRLDATVQIGGGRPSAPAALALGIEVTELPLNNGCVLRTSPGFLLPAALDAGGRYHGVVGLPALGLDRVVLQAVLIDEGATSGFTLSNAVEVRG